MLRRLNPFDDIFDFVKDFDDLRRTMDEFRLLPAEANVPRRFLPVGLVKKEFLPAVECYTKDKQLILKAELPGVDPKDVEISIVADKLVLRGEKKDERKVEEKDYFFQEISRGKFERTFMLPEGVKADQIKAVFNNGILEMTLPALALETAHKVPIEMIDTGKKAVKAA